MKTDATSEAQAIATEVKARLEGHPSAYRREVLRAVLVEFACGLVFDAPDPRPSLHLVEDE